MVKIIDQLCSQTKNEKLTPGMLRKYPGCQDYTYEQAVNIAETLDKLAEIFLKIDSKKFPEL